MHDEVVEALLSPSGGGTLGTARRRQVPAGAGDFASGEHLRKARPRPLDRVKAQVAAFFCRINVDKVTTTDRGILRRAV